jgi:hypothetical protein
MKKLLSIFIFSIIVFILTINISYAWFAIPSDSNFEENIVNSSGTWVVTWEPDIRYPTGTWFEYDGKIWEVRNQGGYPIPPTLGVNLYPYGPYQEITDYDQIINEFRIYNTYTNNDIVLHNGAEFQALHSGMGGTEPGTATGWQELTIEWRFYNIYRKNDVVVHNGDVYVAKFWTTGDEPGIEDVWIIQ